MRAKQLESQIGDIDPVPFHLGPEKLSEASRSLAQRGIWRRRLQERLYEYFPSFVTQAQHLRLLDRLRRRLLRAGKNKIGETGST